MSIKEYVKELIENIEKEYGSIFAASKIINLDYSTLLRWKKGMQIPNIASVNKVTAKLPSTLIPKSIKKTKPVKSQSDPFTILKTTYDENNLISTTEWEILKDDYINKIEALKKEKRKLQNKSREGGITLMGRYVLNFISEYINIHGLPPTQKEIHEELHSKGFGKSPNGLAYAIRKLINAGMLKKEGATRNLWPTGKKTPL